MPPTPSLGRQLRLLDRRSLWMVLILLSVHVGPSCASMRASPKPRCTSSSASYPVTCSRMRRLLSLCPEAVTRHAALIWEACVSRWPPLLYPKRRAIVSKQVEKRVERCSRRSKDRTWIVSTPVPTGRKDIEVDKGFTGKFA